MEFLQITLCALVSENGQEHGAHMRSIVAEIRSALSKAKIEGDTDILPFEDSPLRALFINCRTQEIADRIRLAILPKTEHVCDVVELF